MESSIVLASFLIGVFSHGFRWKRTRAADPMMAKRALLSCAIWLAIFLGTFGLFTAFSVAERVGLTILVVLIVVSFGQLLLFGF